MKRLVLFLTVALMLSYPGMAVSQTKAKTQTQGQTVEKQKTQVQGQAQGEQKATQMVCPMMQTGKMPPEMEKKMKEHMAQMMKEPLEQMQKQIDALRQRVEALEKKK
jgi:hypothetical protein